MKTCLVTPCKLDGKDKDGVGYRLDRFPKYIEYYNNIKDELGFDKIILLDNCSSPENISILRNKMGGLSVYNAEDDGQLDMSLNDNSPVIMYAFEKELSKSETCYYPYYWRAFYFYKTILEKLGYDKILAIDSDCFVLTERAVRYIREFNNGILVPWCAKYWWADPNLYIINKGGCEKYIDFVNAAGPYDRGVYLEPILPYTEVMCQILSSRWGEDRIKQNPRMDVYCECPTDIPMIYNMEGK